MRVSCSIIVRRLSAVLAVEQVSCRRSVRVFSTSTAHRASTPSCRSSMKTLTKDELVTDAICVARHIVVECSVA